MEETNATEIPVFLLASFREKKIQSLIDINISVDRHIQRKDDDKTHPNNHNFVSLSLFSMLFFRLDCSPPTLATDGSNCSITIEGNCGALGGTKARSSSGLRKLKLNLRILNQRNEEFQKKNKR